MLRAGFASVDFTPDRSADLLGYEFRQQALPLGNAGVNDPLAARVLVLDPAGTATHGSGERGGKNLAAIISLDLCILEVDLARHLRMVVARTLGSDWRRVMLACTHTHSGPFPRLGRRTRARGRDRVSRAVSGPGAADVRELEARLADAAARARGLTFPVAVGVREAPLGLGYDRRVITPDGVQHCWNVHESPGLNPAPAPDPTCTVLALRQTNGPRSYVLWSAAAHAVTLGKTSRVVSADWPGAACRLIDADHPYTHSLFASGAAGDVHPWLATQESPAMVAPVARAAAAFVSLLTHVAQPVADPPDAGLQIAHRTVRFGHQDLDLSVWRLAGVWLVALPVELFGALAGDLRRRLPGPVWLATVANGWTGYWPTRAAFAQGGYEVEGAVAFGRKAGDSERLIDAVVDLADTLDG